MSTPSTTGLCEPATLRAIRAFLLVLFVAGMLGAGAELLLVGHTESFWQLQPLILMAVGLVVLSWCVAATSRASIRLFQATMVLFALSGLIGLALHYQGNAQFELEMQPSLSGLELFWKAIQGTTPPTLAPGMMIQLGMLGLAYTYRHPALTGADRKKPGEQE